MVKLVDGIEHDYDLLILTGLLQEVLECDVKFIKIVRNFTSDGGATHFKLTTEPQ